MNELSKLSANTFKKKIKEKAIKYAFGRLLDQKETYKKLDNIHYEDFKIQDYLLNDNFSFEEKIILFRYRTRMACYEENFRAGAEKFMSKCCLCSSHPDSQFVLEQCPILKQKLEDSMTINHLKQINDVYSKNISKNSVNILKLVEEVRTVAKKS